MSAQAPDRLSSLVESRFSPRSFAGVPLSENQKNLLLEAATRSPSAGNQQPWRFITVDKYEQPELFAKLVEILTGNNIRWAHTAPLLVIAIAKEVNDKGTAHPISWYDLGQAMAWLTVQATEMDLYVHQMGGFSRDRARELFNIPEGFMPLTVSAVGYLGKPEGIPEDLRVSETHRMPRRPLSDVILSGPFPAVEATTTV